MPGIWTNEGEGWRLIGRVEALIHPPRLGQGKRAVVAHSGIDQ